MNDLLNQLPPVSQNNERKYWARKIDKFKTNPVEWRGREIEDRFEGLSIDYKDYGADQNVEKGSTEY